MLNWRVAKRRTTTKLQQSATTLQQEHKLQQLTMVDYQEGQQVRILVGGLYKSKKMGIYLKPYGKKMCSMKVDGDSQPSQNLRLTSIAPMTPLEDNNKNSFVTISQSEYKALLDKIDNMSTTLRRLQLRVIAIDVNKKKN
jgi:hypothetical protein